MGAENTQKGNSPTCRRTRYYPASYRRSFIFGEADFLFSSIPSNTHPTQASPNQAPTIKIAEKGKSRVCRADFFIISLAHILRICYLCAINCKHTVNRVLQFGC